MLSEQIFSNILTDFGPVLVHWLVILVLVAVLDLVRLLVHFLIK